MTGIRVNTVLDCADDVTHLRDALNVLGKGNENYSKLLIALSLNDSKRVGRILMRIFNDYCYPKEEIEIKKHNEVNRLNQL